jgi:membrane protein implicated in regulation of membrane protease activity
VAYGDGEDQAFGIGIVLALLAIGLVLAGLGPVVLWVAIVGRQWSLLFLILLLATPFVALFVVLVRSVRRRNAQRSRSASALADGELRRAGQVAQPPPPTPGSGVSAPSAEDPSP